MKRFSSLLYAGALILSFLGGPLAAAPSAQQRLERRSAPARTDVMAPIDAESTRRALMDILAKHPPAVGRVLKLDPSLMRNETYLSSYPMLRDFLAEHQEIPQNATFYFEHIRIDEWHQPRNRQSELIEVVLAGTAGFVAAIIALGMFVWVIRTVLEQRRWNRLSKIQAEVHTKLMDRFSSNDELLTYVQTAPGRRFLESGPSPLPEVTPAMAAPISRILWSVQLGAVLVVSGTGLLVLSRHTVPDAVEFFFVAGCMITALGLGFLVSAAAAYGLSRRLGLLDRPVPDNA